MQKKKEISRTDKKRQIKTKKPLCVLCDLCGKIANENSN